MQSSLAPALKSTRLLILGVAFGSAFISIYAAQAATLSGGVGVSPYAVLGNGAILLSMVFAALTIGCVMPDLDTCHEQLVVGAAIVGFLPSFITFLVMLGGWSVISGNQSQVFVNPGAGFVYSLLSFALFLVSLNLERVRRQMI